jgi:predicted transcriptional regulator
MEPNSEENLDQNIYEKLVSHFGTQELAAKAIGVSQSTIHGYIQQKWGMSERVAIRAQKATSNKFKAVDLFYLLQHDIL